MRGLKTGLLLAGGTLAFGVGASRRSSTQPAAGVYTAEQATIGADRLRDGLRGLPSA